MREDLNGIGVYKWLINTIRSIVSGNKKIISNMVYDNANNKITATYLDANEQEIEFDVGLGDVSSSSSSSTDNAVARFDGTSGKLIKTSNVSIDNTGNINIPSGAMYKRGGSDLSYTDVGAAASNHNHDSVYAPISKGVTNGDSHDHYGGDGAQIDHNNLANKGTNTHAQIDSHISAAAPHSGHALLSHTHAGTDITSGTIDGDRLPSMSSTKKGGVPPTGTPSGKFLRDDGTWQSIASGGSESESVVVLGSDVSNSTTTLADATGLSFSLDANSLYIVEGYIVWDTSATANGIKIACTVPSGATINAGHFITDAATGTPDSNSWNANDVATATSASPFTTGNLGKVNAICKTSSTSGTWQLRFACETTGTITIKAGSVLRYRKVA